MRDTNLRRLVIVLCVIVSASMIGLGAMAADDFENIIRNGDFEEGIAEWELRQSEGAAGTLKEEKEEVVKGDRSVFVEIDNVAKTSAWHMALFQDGHTIEKGETYTFAIWLKGEEPRPVTFYVEEQAAPWTGHGRTDFQLTEEWQEYWITFTAPITFPVWLRVTLGLSDVNLYADNARFFLGEYVEDEDDSGPKIAVDPAGKFAITWAEIKSD
ncbi:carbohydrate binding domain-containing protein [Candidatus Poribacteria bacterium]